MSIKGEWYYSDNIHKRRAISYYQKIKSYIYYRPFRFIGKLVGGFIKLLPIQFSASVKESIKVDFMMPQSDIMVIVDGLKDIGRATFCNKERSTIDWIKKYYQEGDVIFDIGANIGAVSLISAEYLQKCKVYAFEPLPTTFSMLFKNIMENQYGHKITPLNMALSDKLGVDNFFLSSVDAGSSGHSVSRGMPKGEQSFCNKLEVFTTTMDYLIKDYNINYPNHLKIDVDGCDYEVLLGGELTLSNNALQTILIERNDKADSIIDLLTKYGFKQVEISTFKDAGTRENMGFVRL